MRKYYFLLFLFFLIVIDLSFYFIKIKPLKSGDQLPWLWILFMIAINYIAYSIIKCAINPKTCKEELSALEKHINSIADKKNKKSKELIEDEESEGDQTDDHMHFGIEINIQITKDNNKENTDI